MGSALNEFMNIYANGLAPIGLQESFAVTSTASSPAYSAAGALTLKQTDVAVQNTGGADVRYTIDGATTPAVAVGYILVIGASIYMTRQEVVKLKVWCATTSTLTLQPEGSCG